MTMKPFEIQSTALSIGGVRIETSLNSKLVIPGITRATVSVAIEVEDKQDQTRSWNVDAQTLQIIDGYTYEVNFNGYSQQIVGWTAAQYAADDIDGEGFIDGISIVDGGAGYTGEAVTFSQTMYASEDGSTWYEIPFRVRCGAGDIESEFGSGGGASALDQLNDVDISNLQDGEVLAWNANDEVWKNVTISGGGGGGTGDISFSGTSMYADNDVDIYTNSETYAEVWLRDNYDVLITADGENNSWKFQAGGNLVFPDSTVQTTAYPGPSSSASVFTSDTAPSSPTEGDLWFDTVSGQMYIYFENTWVDSSPSSSGGSGSSDRLINSGKEVILDNGGNLSMPVGGAIWFDYGYIDQDTGVDIDALRVSGGNGVSIKAGEDSTTWRFNSDGTITFPDSTVQSTAFTGAGGTSLPSDAAGYLRNDGSGTLSWNTNTVSAGASSYSDVWVLTDKADNFWTEWALSGNVGVLFNGGGGMMNALTWDNSYVYGKQLNSGDKNFIINNGAVHSQKDCLVLEFPSSPSVGDVIMSPAFPSSETLSTGTDVTVGVTYTITSTGTTNWTAVGAPYNGAGSTFTATQTFAQAGTPRGSGLATYGLGVDKIVWKPAYGQRFITSGMMGGSTMPGAGVGFDYIAGYVPGAWAQQPVSFMYAGLVDSIPTWYQGWF